MCIIKFWRRIFEVPIDLPAELRVIILFCFFVMAALDVFFNSTCKSGFKSGLYICSPTYVDIRQTSITEIQINFGEASLSVRSQVGCDKSIISHTEIFVCLIDISYFI